MSDDSMYKKAERRADEKIDFYNHLYGFIGGNVILIIINAITSFGSWWFLWITCFWGIALIIHFLKTFVFTKGTEDKRDAMIEKELEKMKK